MKAAVLYKSPGTFEIADIRVDDPRPHEVLVRLAATGLCHTDLHFTQVGIPLPDPLVLGHEGAGVVEAVGSDVTYVAPGDHVVAFPAPFCGRCEWCLSGRSTLCANVGLTRSPGDAPRLHAADGSRLEQFFGLGTFAEQVLVHENALVKIEPDISLVSASMVGCAVPTGIGAVIRTARVPPGATVAVVGCGGVGLNVIQGAVLAGASRIVAIDIHEAKLTLASQFGATDLIDNRAGDAVAQLAELLPAQLGVDYAFEAIGSRATYELTFALTRMGGTATAIGGAPGTFELPMNDFMVEKKFQGSRMGSVQFRRDLPYFLDLYRQGRLKLDELVSSRIPLDDINEGYRALGDGAIARSVVVFD